MHRELTTKSIHVKKEANLIFTRKLHRNAEIIFTLEQNTQTADALLIALERKMNSLQDSLKTKVKKWKALKANKYNMRKQYLMSKQN